MSEREAYVVDGKKVGAYGIVLTPKGLILVEKPGKGRGLELPGGHGEEADAPLVGCINTIEEAWAEALKECFKREVLEETGVDIGDGEIRFIVGPTQLPTHYSAICFTQIAYNPKTLKQHNCNDEGEITEIVHVLKLREVKEMRGKLFSPHLRHIEAALKMLETGGSRKI